jgi:uncharacterized protein
VSEVLALWRYPVKSMQGEQLEDATIGRRGIVGDRGWAVVDTGTGLALTARRAPELLFASATLVDDTVRITLPDGSVAADDAALSSWLGRTVTLVRADETTSGTYEIAPDFEREDRGEWARWSGPMGTFHDSTRTQVSIIGADSVGSWDMRRFRPNVVIEGTGEDTWFGARIAIGSATVEVAKLIDRCVITTRPQPGDVERDLDVLRTINRGSGTLGIGTLVRAEGTVRVGDAVGPVD